MTDPGGTADEPSSTFKAGTRLGKYEIVRLLGAGGMGAVYEASHTEIGKRVAIKVLSPAVAAVPGARARFLREAQLTSSLRHPNIVDVTDMGSEEGQTFLVMEFLRGEDLSQRLVRIGPLTGPDLVDIMLPVCSAVVEAHQAGITHRDLKPQNIFLAAGPHGTLPKVLDFGISKGNDLQSGTLTGTGAMIGTPFYLAPEQIMDTRSAGPQSDQYALGVIMYECLTGARPFEAENLFVVFQAIVAGKPTRPRDRRPDISLPLQEVVLRAMNVDPKLRFPSTKALGHALLPFASARVRPIWEEAFSLPPSEQAVAAATQAAADSVEAGVAGVPGGTKILGPESPDPDAKSWDRIQAEVGGSGRHRAVRRTDVTPDTQDLYADKLVARARRTKRIAALAGGVGLGVIAAIAIFGGDGKVEPRGPTVGVVAPPVTTLPAAPAAPVAEATPAAPAPPAATAPAPAAPPAAAPPRVPTFEVSVMVDPPAAAIEFDGESAGEGRFDRTVARDHKRHRLRLSADGYIDRVIEFTDAPPPPVVRLARVARPQAARPPEEVAAPRPRPRPRPLPPEAPQSLNPNGAPVID